MKDITDLIISVHDWLILWETSILHACVNKSADLKNEDLEIMISEQISIELQYIYDK